jgi:hypothetical protein
MPNLGIIFFLSGLPLLTLFSPHLGPRAVMLGGGIGKSSLKYAALVTTSPQLIPVRAIGFSEAKEKIAF